MNSRSKKILMIAGEGILCIVMTIMILYAFIWGTVNYSLRYNPPTQAELAEDPSLIRFK